MVNVSGPGWVRSGNCEIPNPLPCTRSRLERITAIQAGIPSSELAITMRNAPPDSPGQRKLSPRWVRGTQQLSDPCIPRTWEFPSALPTPDQREEPPTGSITPGRGRSVKQIPKSHIYTSTHLSELRDFRAAGLFEDHSSQPRVWHHRQPMRGLTSLAFHQFELARLRRSGCREN